jgi:hypothetical protein
MKPEDIFITNDTAKNDPIIQKVMQDCINDLMAQKQRRDRIRAGLEPAPAYDSYGTWNISDRN